MTEAVKQALNTMTDYLGDNEAYALHVTLFNEAERVRALDGPQAPQVSEAFAKLSDALGEVLTNRGYLGGDKA